MGDRRDSLDRGGLLAETRSPFAAGDRRSPPGSNGGQSGARVSRLSDSGVRSALRLRPLRLLLPRQTPGSPDGFSDRFHASSRGDDLVRFADLAPMDPPARRPGSRRRVRHDALLGSRLPRQWFPRSSSLGRPWAVFFTPLAETVLAAAPDDAAGGASSLVILTRLVGMAIGTSVLTGYILQRVSETEIADAATLLARCRSRLRGRRLPRRGGSRAPRHTRRRGRRRPPAGYLRWSTPPERGPQTGSVMSSTMSALASVVTSPSFRCSRDVPQQPPHDLA